MLFISLAIAGFAFALDVLSPPDEAKVRKLLQRARDRGEIVPIDQLADGTVAAIRARVATGGDELRAPLTGRPCVYWRIVIDEVGAKDFVELGRNEQGVPFLVRSDAGVMRVVPERARIAVVPHQVTTQMPAALHERSRNAHGDPLVDLARRTIRNWPNHYTTTLRVREYAITAGAVLTMSGFVTLEANPDGAAGVQGYRADLPMRPVMSGSRRARLLIAD